MRELIFKNLEPKNIRQLTVNCAKVSIIPLGEGGAGGLSEIVNSIRLNYLSFDIIDFVFSHSLGEGGAGGLTETKIQFT